MKPRSSYPLAAAESVRNAALTKAESAFRAAEASWRAAEEMLHRAQAELSDHEAATSAAVAAETARAESLARTAGGGSADELLRLDAYRRGRAAEARQLGDRLAARQLAVTEAATHRDDARARMTECKREAKLLEKHHEAWSAAEGREAERREEAEREDRSQGRAPHVRPPKGGR